MNGVTITKTADYLVLKIPLEALKIGRRSDSHADRAVKQGLEALTVGRFSGPFKSTRSATKFLRSL